MQSCEVTVLELGQIKEWGRHGWISEDMGGSDAGWFLAVNIHLGLQRTYMQWRRVVNNPDIIGNEKTHIRGKCP